MSETPPRDPPSRSDPASRSAGRRPRTRRSSPATGPSVPKARSSSSRPRPRPSPPRRDAADLAVAARPAVLVLGGLGAYFYFTQDDDDAGSDRRRRTTATTRRRSSSVRVPDVVGTTSRRRPRRSATPASRPTWSRCRRTQPSGQVVAQSPAAGSDAPEGSTVRLNVAQAAGRRSRAADDDQHHRRRRRPPRPRRPPTTEPATVPDVVGEELADAARAFGDEGAEGRPSSTSRRTSRRGGSSRRPSRPARSSSAGDTVQVNVSIGPEPAADAAGAATSSGSSRTEAASTLDAGGLRGARTRARAQPCGRESASSRSRPPPARCIPRGSLVLLYVGADWPADMWGRPPA